VIAMPGPADSRLALLQRFGQSPWFDYISREFVARGGLRRMVDRDGLGGVTSLRDLVRVLTLFGCVVFSLRAGLRGVLGLQGSLRRADRGQPALPPGQLNR